MKGETWRWPIKSTYLLPSMVAIEPYFFSVSYALLIAYTGLLVFFTTA